MPDYKEKSLCFILNDIFSYLSLYLEMQKISPRLSPGIREMDPAGPGLAPAGGGAGRRDQKQSRAGVDEHQESPGHDSSSSHQQKSPSWIETITHVLFHAPRLMTLSKWIIFLNNKRIIMPIIMPEHSLVGFFKRCIMWSSLYLKHK